MYTKHLVIYNKYVIDTRNLESTGGQLKVSNSMGWALQYYVIGIEKDIKIIIGRLRFFMNNVKVSQHVLCVLSAFDFKHYKDFIEHKHLKIKCFLHCKQQIMDPKRKISLAESYCLLHIYTPYYV